MDPPNWISSAMKWAKSITVVVGAHLAIYLNCSSFPFDIPEYRTELYVRSEIKWPNPFKMSDDAMRHYRNYP